jgi:peroxiredoxin Q/BCP
VQVLGVSFDTPPVNRAFAEKFNYNFPLLCDTERKLGMAYGACTDPKAGSAKRISYLIGADGRIKKAYGKVNAATHAEEVLQDI